MSSSQILPNISSWMTMQTQGSITMNPHHSEITCWIRVPDLVFKFPQCLLFCCNPRFFPASFAQCFYLRLCLTPTINFQHHVACAEPEEPTNRRCATVATNQNAGHEWHECKWPPAWARLPKGTNDMICLVKNIISFLENLNIYTITSETGPVFSENFEFSASSKPYKLDPMLMAHGFPQQPVLFHLRISGCNQPGMGYRKIWMEMQRRLRISWHEDATTEIQQICLTLGSFCYNFYPLQYYCWFW